MNKVLGEVWGVPEALLVGLFLGRGENQALVGWSHVIDDLKYHIKDLVFIP